MSDVIRSHDVIQSHDVIRSHINDICSNLPNMNVSNTISSTIEVEDYKVTIIISKKQSVLGKRRHQSEECRMTVPKIDNSDNLLYNSFGHNFVDM